MLNSTKSQSVDFMTTLIRQAVPEDKQPQLYDDWTTGMNYRQLAERYGCGQATVGRVIQKEHRRRGHLRDAHYERIQSQLREQYDKANELDKVGDAIRATVAESDLLGITGRAADIKVDVGVDVKVRDFHTEMRDLAKELDVWKSGNAHNDSTPRT